jgi:hypothetical protein
MGILPHIKRVVDKVVWVPGGEGRDAYGRTGHQEESLQVDKLFLPDGRECDNWRKTAWKQRMPYCREHLLGQSRRTKFTVGMRIDCRDYYTLCTSPKSGGANVDTMGTSETRHMWQCGTRQAKGDHSQSVSKFPSDGPGARSMWSFAMGAGVHST